MNIVRVEPEKYHVNTLNKLDELDCIGIRGLPTTKSPTRIFVRIVRTTRLKCRRQVGGHKSWISTQPYKKYERAAGMQILDFNVTN